jgi:hypothetical protein
MSALTAAGALRSTPGMKTVRDDGRTIRRSALTGEFIVSKTRLKTSSLEF